MAIGETKRTRENRPGGASHVQDEKRDVFSILRAYNE